MASCSRSSFKGKAMPLLLALALLFGVTAFKNVAALLPGNLMGRGRLYTRSSGRSTSRRIESDRGEYRDMNVKSMWTTKNIISNPVKMTMSSVVDVVDSPASPNPMANAIPPSQQKEMKLGVLLLNLGGPERTQDVEGFLFNLFADPDIIRLPSILSLLQKPIAYVISKRRAPKSTQAYEAIGGGSPIVKYTQAQASQIQDILISRGYNAKCYFAMRYWNPYTEEVLERMRKDEINTIVIVPLYPQYSISTSGSSLKVLQDIFYKNPEHWGPDKVSHTVVPAWFYRDGYVKAMAKLILNEVVQYTPEEFKQGLHVLFSAHGVPQSYIEAGDPYQRQIEECVCLISKEIANQISDPTTRPQSISQQDADNLLGIGNDNPLKIHLSFQSRVGPVQWLQPYTENMLEDLGHAGVKNLIVVPISFVSEHIETLEEIDMEYQELAIESGVKKWRRVPALNTDNLFITDMADLVVDALESPSLSLSEVAGQELDQQIGGGANGGASGGGGGGAGSRLGSLSLSRDAEMIPGRFAMLGIVGASLIEFMNGTPILKLVGLK